jgi:hypothetical protein
LQERLSGQGMQTLILTYTKSADVIHAIEAGADLAASRYYDVAYIKKMLL